ncbi:MAG: GntR family transcriptional regulator, partial [Acidimicrobiales bacterium]
MPDGGAGAEPNTDRACTIGEVRVAARRPPWLSSSPDLATANGTPVHVSIARWLTDLIGRGELVPGDRLPSEDKLAALLGVSRMTLRQA